MRTPLLTGLLTLASIVLVYAAIIAMTTSGSAGVVFIVLAALCAAGTKAMESEQ